jgi:beta-glucosidase/6-phospho-beta-glucosidase/beta-galactosidase
MQARNVRNGWKADIRLVLNNRCSCEFCFRSSAIGHPMEPGRASRDAIFPTFFMTGFECSTFVWKDRGRKDYVRETGHDCHLANDFAAAMDLGVGVVREAIRWPFVDLGNGRYDWSSVKAIQDAATECKITPIWDLCHYGLPDNCDPFSSECRERFADYCRAVAEFVTSTAEGPYFFTPINEITFFSAAASDLGWMYPFAKGREAELKRSLCRMSIEGAKAIREVEPNARMVHVDPMIQAVPPPGRLDLADEAEAEERREDFGAFDVLSGRCSPELGGSSEILDIVGVNVYHYSQVQLDADKKREILGPRDPRRKPLSELLKMMWDRYRRPLIIGETSGYQEHRAEWLRMTMEESFKAINAGVDLHGVCLYPFVDVPDWWSNKWAKIGVYDVADKSSFDRVPCEAYIQELRRWQKILDQPGNVEPSGYGDEWGRVQLDEVRRYAAEWSHKNVVAREEVHA